jgi:predicted phosphate transport protein (TIGR00153 family)
VPVGSRLTLDPEAEGTCVVRILPRDQEFFAMFAQLALRLTSSARLLNQLFQETDRLDEHAAAIKAVEHEADDLTREIIGRIDRTFVTPIDREDIHLLASRLDNVIDLLDGTARRAQVFGIRRTHDAARNLTEVLIRAGTAIESAVVSVRKPRIVSDRMREVKRLEEEADVLYQEALATLFAGTPDPLEVIKWKDLLDLLENAMDECEDVANVLESISLKHS